MAEGYPKRYDLLYINSEFKTITESLDRSRDKLKSLQRMLSNTMNIACEYLSFLQLKEEAIPSKWPNLASYLSSLLPTPRPTQASTSTNRVHLENERLEALEYAMFMEETVLSAQDLYDKLFSQSLPSGFLLHKTNKVALAKIIHSDMKGLDITACLDVKEASF
ncbi:uncharacterized protein [Lepeophtheirus salmonis]|uniref:uncharacterized protein n=1 Tax=Lepeophtheirus salmonis TaxID=72036 RepID=UPI001AE20476|nr:uncharacterized protein LOC121117066 [Lepeophtheirus salmonis]